MEAGPPKIRMRQWFARRVRWNLMDLPPLLSFLIIIAVSLTQSRCDRASSDRDAHVEQTLTKYVTDGLTVDDVLGPVNSTITVSGDFFTYRVGTTEQMADQVREMAARQGAVSTRNISPRQFLLEIVSIFTKDTPYSDRVQINAPPRANFLSIYFLKADPHGLVTHFRNNCAYIGWGNAIICDGNFVKAQLDALTKLEEFHSIAIVNIAERRRLKPNELDGKTKSVIDNLMRGGFFAWFLGHEIGHAVLHADYPKTSGRNVHFDDPDYDHRELEADLYVARALAEPSALTANFWNTMGEFIEHEYRRLYKELVSLGKTSEVDPTSEFFPLRYQLTVEYSPYNMPLLLRASRIIDVLTQQSPGLDSTGYYQALRKNIKATRSHESVFGRIAVILSAVVLAAAAGTLIVMQMRRRKR